MNNEHKLSYRQIFKATGLFGGVQVLIIIIGLVRAKIIAILLGTSGFGINSLLNSPLALITTITGLGITYSAVRDISKTNGENDISKLSRIVSVFRYLVFFTGLLGIVVTLILSPLLSKWSFGNYSYTIAFIVLSFTVYFSTVSNGQLAYLRGIRQLAATARASVLGPALSIIVTLPVIYFFRKNGIVPIIFITALFTLFSSWYYSRKYPVKILKLTSNEVFKEGSGMVRLGLVMTIAGLLSQSVGYFINIFVSAKGGIAEVGLYNAGWSLTNQYVGLIFAAMAVDYFPRLASFSEDNPKIKEIVNQQGEIILLLLTPLLMGFILFIPYIIRILFSRDFISIIPFVQWVAVGMLFRASSWVIAFIPGAKGDTRFFLLIEVIGSIVYFTFSVIGYYYWGKLEGVGIAFVLNYIIYLLLVLVLSYLRYNFLFSYQFLKVFCVQLIMLSSIVICVRFSASLTSYIISGTILFLNCFYSIYQLNKRTGILLSIKQIFKW